MGRIAGLAGTLLLTLLSCASNQKMSNQKIDIGEITERRFGSLPSGEQVDLYTLRNAKGVEAAITNYGGRIVSLKTPDRNGEFGDIVLGFDDLQGYLQKNPYFGAIAATDKDTVINLTNHSYFDLSGKATGNILDDQVTI